MGTPRRLCVGPEHHWASCYPAEGVEVYPGTLISKAVCEEGKVKITTEDGKEVGEGRGVWVCECVGVGVCGGGKK